MLVYNADLLLGLLTLTGGCSRRSVPSIKTAVAYPLANKFRTGMTIAMISLVMFSLVMFSTMNENFDRIFLSDDALGGYEVQVTENPGNPIDDLESALRNASPPPAPANGDDAGPTGDEIADQIVNDDPLLVANQQVADVVQLNAEEPEASGYPIFGMSPEFVENNELTFSARATGFATDEDILRALAENPDYAIIDNFAIGGGFDTRRHRGRRAHGQDLRADPDGDRRLRDGRVAPGGAHRHHDDDRERHLLRHVRLRRSLRRRI